MSVVADVSEPVAAVTTPPPPVVLLAPLWRLSVDQYHAMVTCGILGEDDEVELVYTDPTGPADQPEFRKRQDCEEAEQVPVVIAGGEVAQDSRKRFAAMIV